MHDRLVQDETMWQEMSDIKDVLDSMEIAIDLKKVKSHATRAEMDRGLSSPQLKHGNDRADHYAALGSEIYQISQNDHNLVSMVDSRTWLIQKRLLHIAARALATYFIPGCVGRGVRLGSESSSGGGGGGGVGGGVWKFGVQKMEKIKFLKVQIRSAQNVRKVWIGRKKILPALFGAI